MDSGVEMKPIKKVRGYLVAEPHSEEAHILRALVLALGEQSRFALADLYRLDHETFKLALALLRDWRIDRHYAAQLDLFDVATMGIRPVVERRRKARVPSPRKP